MTTLSDFENPDDIQLKRLLGKSRFQKLSAEEEQDLRNLVVATAPILKSAPLEKIIETALIQMGYRNILFEQKVREIKDEINRWGALPGDPYELIDSAPFATVSYDVKAYLKKVGGQIKIYSTNVGDLDISVEELGDRIGTGLDFLELLSRRLNAFKVLIFSKAKSEPTCAQI